MPATPHASFDHKFASQSNSDAIPPAGTGTLFSLRYDKLVIAVGAYSQTFDVPGVKEHAHFLKDVKDARSIRTRILECGYL
jgi:NADPH-dependent 2,4-dienoyl-CoA reductase/sulfur reductase-like enzyme